jgi:hypothetical protein
MNLASSHVELHVPDFAPARSFYPSIGFKIAWERPPEGEKGYLVLTLEDNVLCFFGGNSCVDEHLYFKKFAPASPRGYGVEIILLVRDIQDTYARVSKSAPIFEPLVLRPWGVADFRVIYPYGFYLRFSAIHDTRDPKHAVS